jgi:shikimate dehydrogenase
VNFSQTFTPNGGAKLIGMVGSPISSAQSPGLFNGAFSRKNINCLMVPLAVRPENIKQTMELFMLLENSIGILVTMPFKQAAANLISIKSQAVEILGAANLITKDANSKAWYSYMLDGEAVIKLLNENAKELVGASATIIGCGGAGSACAYSLLESGVDRINLIDMDPTKAKLLQNVLAKFFPKVEFSQSPLQFVRPSDVIINASPVGTANQNQTMLFEMGPGFGTSFVIDLANSMNADTLLISEARARGITAFSGADVARAQAPLIAQKLGFKELFDSAQIS